MCFDLCQKPVQESEQSNSGPSGQGAIIPAFVKYTCSRSRDDLRVVNYALNLD